MNILLLMLNSQILSNFKINKKNSLTTLNITVFNSMRLISSFYTILANIMTETGTFTHLDLTMKESDVANSL